MADVVVPPPIAANAEWYDRHARRNHAAYFGFKISQMAIAATIPVVAVFIDTVALKPVTALLGAAVGIIEGVLQVGQFHENWLRYRATREALRREELLFVQEAGPYAEAGGRAARLFAERADGIMSGENAKWLASLEKPVKPPPA
jgi:hypothetical protein